MLHQSHQKHPEAFLFFWFVQAHFHHLHPPYVYSQDRQPVSQVRKFVVSSHQQALLEGKYVRLSRGINTYRTHHQMHARVCCLGDQGKKLQTAWCRQMSPIIFLRFL